MPYPPTNLYKGLWYSTDSLLCWYNLKMCCSVRTYMEWNIERKQIKGEQDR